MVGALSASTSAMIGCQKVTSEIAGNICNKRPRAGKGSTTEMVKGDAADFVAPGRRDGTRHVNVAIGFRLRGCGQSSARETNSDSRRRCAQGQVWGCFRRLCRNKQFDDGRGRPESPASKAGRAACCRATRRALGNSDSLSEITWSVAPSGSQNRVNPRFKSVAPARYEYATATAGHS